MNCGLSQLIAMNVQVPRLLRFLIKEIRWYVFFYTKNLDRRKIFLSLKSLLCVIDAKEKKSLKCNLVKKRFRFHHYVIVIIFAVVPHINLILSRKKREKKIRVRYQFNVSLIAWRLYICHDLWIFYILWLNF